MNLADHIMHERGGALDLFNSITSISAALEKAQRFDVSDDVVKAAGQLVDSKPSSLLAALPMCRLPYETMWIEYRGGLGPPNENVANRPIPARQGFLIETPSQHRDLASQVGLATLAWVHTRPEEGIDNAVNVGPFSIYFDWRPDGDVHEVIREMHAVMLECWPDKRSQPVVASLVKIFSMKQWFDPASIANFFLSKEQWKKYANNKTEIEALHELERHLYFGLSPHGLSMLIAATLRGIEQLDEMRMLFANWLADIQGEGIYLQCFLAMLNSRNCVEHTRVDLSRLNKARQRRGKRPLLEFTHTKLTLSRSQARVAEASGISRAQAQQHLVRGHFKIRVNKHTGIGNIFWWSPHLRGDASRPVKRVDYTVEA